MIKGKTKSGFEFAIEEEALNNMEMLFALTEVDDGNAAAIARVCNLLLGKEQAKALCDHLKNEKGYIPIEVFDKEFTDIMNEVGKKGKNS